MTIQESLSSATTTLTPITDSPSLDAEVLLAHVLGQDKSFLYGHLHKSLSYEHERAFFSLVAKRVHHTPVAYLTGHKEFFGHNFIVNSSVLIPRPDTELLVERAIMYARALAHRQQTPISVLDVGTGSGCIAISLAVALLQPAQSMQRTDAPSADIIGLDASQLALTVARENAQRLCTPLQLAHLQFIHSDLISQLDPGITPDIIVANLPYISEEEYRTLSPDVHNEPIAALLSDHHGLAHDIRLLEQIQHLPVSRQPAIILYEISPSQKDELIQIIHQMFPLARVLVQKDLAQRDRCVEIILEHTDKSRV